MIDSEHVLTCAHVVDGADRATVVLLERPALGPICATVVLQGRWRENDGHDDVALLRLDQSVDVPPAKFARVNALHERRLELELHVYGFPRGFDREGADTRVHAYYRTRHRGEWAQLEAADGQGIRLQRGFSGAAVCFADTGEIVGMVIGADTDERTRTGTMLPLRQIRSFWPGLVEYLPVGKFSDSAAKELRRWVARLPENLSASQVYAASVRDRIIAKPRTEFRRVLDVIEFLAEDVTTDGTENPDEPLARLCEVLANRTLDPLVAGEIRRWAATYLSVDGRKLLAQESAASPQVAVVARLIPSAIRGLMSVTIWTTVAGVAQTMYSEQMPVSRLRKEVPALVLDATFSISDELPLMIIFELPITKLSMAVDTWPVNGAPIGYWFPVVVRESLPPYPSGRSRHLKERWKAVCAQPIPEIHLIACRDERPSSRILAWLLANIDRAILAIADRPNSTLKAASQAGVPVMMWTRTKCPDHDGEPTEPCAGARFVAELADALAAVPPDGLPARVRRLRAHAAAEGVEGHPVQDMTLYWDDPRLRFDESPLGLAD
ncbi:trypsin-like peptidase domain-containing protein [Nocardia brasiliensis]|uniref:VMAP-C domain-containing protein n=1 Tax=Nocardia brasiliensis TaxID=37326 RepID=UPI002457B207|nr:trypsin-like peptidase domain-containing protein [Nocardia brasiliensis]